jgi:hypothetical protein
MFQSSSLSLIKSEFDNVFSEILDHIDLLVRNFNQEALSNFIGRVDQVRGVAKLIELPAVEAATISIIGSLQRYEQLDNEGQEEVLDKISYLIVKTQTYIEFIMNKHQDIPELLLPPINELRRHEKLSPLRESSFFKMQEDLAPLMFDMNTPSGSKRAAKIKRIRLMYQIGLVSVLTNQNSKAGLEMLGRSLMRLAETTCRNPSKSLWWLAGAIVACIHDGQLHLTHERKRLFGEIDRTIREFITSARKESLVYCEPELATNLCYLIALIPSPQPAVTQLMELYQVPKAPINEQSLLAHHRMYSGPDDAVVKSAILSVHEEVTAMLSRLRVVSRDKSTHNDSLKMELRSELRQISNILSILELSQDQSEIARLEALLDSLGKNDQNSQIGDMFNEIIETLQGVSNSIARIEEVRNTIKKQSSKPSLLDESGANTCIEYRVTMQRCNQNLQHYYDKPNEELLVKLPSLFAKVAEGLTFIGFDQMAAVLFETNQVLTAMSTDNGLTLDKDQVEALADISTSVDYYLEGLLSNQTMLDRVIQLAQESLAALKQS